MSKSEKAFSLFTYGDEKYINEIGYVLHPIDVSDEVTEIQMKDSVKEDFKIAMRFKLAKRELFEDFKARQRLGTYLELFSYIFHKEEAEANPLILLTSIVDGEPKIDWVTSAKPFSFDEVQGTLFSGYMVDYLTKYRESGKLNIPKLINDDYFKAIKLLLNNKLYVSGTKLIFSCIDTLSHVEYGDIQGSFKLWLTEFADLSPYDFTVDDLWEFRNSLLHMSNMESRKVMAGKHSKLIIHVGNIPNSEKIKNGTNTKYFEIYKFYRTLADSIYKWSNSMDEKSDRMVNFVKRYDQTVSDIRVATLGDNDKNSSSPGR